MKLKITPKAEERIKQRIEGKDLLIKLKYDTDGCGCAVSGVPTLYLMERQQLDEEHDLRIETNAMDIYIEKSKTIFFDEDMQIDYSPDSQTFRLTSPGQILNPRMNCMLETV